MASPAVKKARVREHVVIEYDAAGAVAASNGILPSHGLPGLEDRPDNAAIATRTINVGEPLIVHGETVCGASTFDVPEGHRFAARPIKAGENITSWGIPFGVALRDIPPGEYLCNIKVCV